MSNNTEIARRDAALPWNAAQVDALRATVTPELNEPEFFVFAEVCRASGLNPFARQIHAVKRQGRMTIQTGIDGFRLIAARTGQHAGTTDPVFDVEDQPHPGRATVTVYRTVNGERIAYTATARWSEYVQLTREGKVNSMWERMPYHMLGKCSEALALRKAFPAEMSGIYTDDEMSAADGTPQRRNVTPAPKEPAKPTEPAKPKHHESWTRDHKRFFAALAELGHDYEDVANWTSESDDWGRLRPSEMGQLLRDEVLNHLTEQKAKKSAQPERHDAEVS